MENRNDKIEVKACAAPVCSECGGNGVWEQGVCLNCMGTGSLTTTYRDDPKFRHIICFLKHGGEKLHAIWLAKKMGGFSDLMEAKRWVEELSHLEPITIEGWLNRDKSSPNNATMASAGLPSVSGSGSGEL